MKNTFTYVFIILLAIILVRHHFHKPSIEPAVNTPNEVVQNSVKKNSPESLVAQRTIAQSNNPVPQLKQEVKSDEITGNKDNKDNLRARYPQIKEVLFRAPMSPEIWATQLQKMAPEMRRIMEKLGPPETAILTPDNQPIVASTDLKPVSNCDALNDVQYAVTVSINEKGQVQDAFNTDPENQAPIPEGIFGCTFQPYTFQGATSPVVTALIPNSELEIAAQMVKQAYQQHLQ